MSHPVTGIDHLFILANDLEKSANNFHRFGFTLSPRGLHSKEQGTANYTIMFKDDYFELLGIVEETAANRDKRDNLEEFGEGLYAIAGRIDNALKAQQHLLELGFDVTDPQNFSRPVDLADGRQGIAAFSTIAFNQREVPKGQVFMCEQKTRNMVWRPELLTHKNGAIGLLSVSVLSATPEKTALRYARLFKDGHSNQQGDDFVVSTGENSATIRVSLEQNFKKHFPTFNISKLPENAYAALAIKVQSLEKAKAVLVENNVASETTGENSIAIAPELASGTILEFVEKN